MSCPIHAPDLQRSSTQHSCALVLGHVRRSASLLIRNLLFLELGDGVPDLLLLARVAAFYYHVVFRSVVVTCVANILSFFLGFTGFIVVCRLFDLEVIFVKERFSAAER